jgi:diaminopimelate epimerase
MSKSIAINFSKFHGLGNDFILTNARGLPKALPALARAITNRHTGVGADGIIVVLPPQDKNNQAKIRIFNADGSEPEMSGNGIRCAGAFLLAEKGHPRRLKIETNAGLKTLELLSSGDNRWSFRVQMGTPILDPSRIPFAGGNLSAPVVGFRLPTDAGAFPVTVTSIGNPHCTLFLRSFDAIDWHAVGREIERNPRFPNRTNVEFVKVISPREIEVRFWERGVGVTNSSGTGSCGATVASILNGYTAREVRVRTVAGNLEIAWPKGGEVILTGPVERVSKGAYYYRAGLSNRNTSER